MIDFNIRRKRGKHSDLVKHNGFTLAEVLVTLGIIGVVSAMTVPTLVQNYQRKSYVTQLHKVYNELGQAAERYKTDNNYVSLKESRIVGNKEELNKFVKTYFKIVKDCGGSYSSCFADSYEWIDSSQDKISTDTHECWSTVVLASGAALCVDSGKFEANQADKDMNGDGQIDENDKIYNGGVQGDAAITIEIDINGLQGPNIVGRDLFAVNILSDGTVVGNPGSHGGYSVKIIEDGWEMNY